MKEKKTKGTIMSDIRLHGKEFQKKQDEALEVLGKLYRDYWSFREFLVNALLDNVSYKGYYASAILKKWVGSIIGKTGLEYQKFYVNNCTTYNYPYNYAGDLVVGIPVYDEDCDELFYCEETISGAFWHKLFVIIFNELIYETRWEADTIEALVILDRVIEMDKYICDLKEKELNKTEVKHA